MKKRGYILFLKGRVMNNGVNKLSDLLVLTTEYIQASYETEAFDAHREWVCIVGNPVALHSTLVDIRNGKVVVKVTHPGWAQYLLLKKDEIVHALRRRYPSLGVTGMSTYVDSTSRSPSAKKDMQGLSVSEKQTRPVPELAEVFEQLRTLFQVKTEEPSH